MPYQILRTPDGHHLDGEFPNRYLVFQVPGGEISVGCCQNNDRLRLDQFPQSQSPEHDRTELSCAERGPRQSAFANKA